jgi:polyvinyl alcohol dehydrogenase (cytochrome)
MIKTLIIFFISLLAFPSHASELNGQTIFQQSCASCHTGKNSQIPSLSLLQQLSPGSISDALNTGTMRQIGASLSVPERKAVVEFVTGKTLKPNSKEQFHLKYCDSKPSLGKDFLQQPKWNGWGVDLENTRYQPANEARLSSKDIPELKLKWAFAYPGEVLALGQTNVIGGRLFVPSNSGNIYSLDAVSGCAYWRFKADSSVRTAISAGRESEDAENNYVVYFIDTTANTYAVNAETGELVWKTRIDKHPAVRVTGAPQLYKGKLYVPVSTLEAVTATDPNYPCCTQRGSVVSLDAYSGKIIWQSFTILEEPKQTSQSNASGTSFYGPSGAGIWSAPTIDTKLNRLYVGTGENSSEPASQTSDSILAMDLKDGKMLWVYQSTRNDAWNAACISEDRSNCPAPEGPDYDFGASPILVSLNEKQRVLIAVQKSGEVHALDPDNNGALLWKQQASPGGFQGGVMWGAASDGSNVYVALSDRQGDQYTRPDGSGDWKIKSDKGGGLHAYRVSDGKLIWRAAAPICDERVQCSPAQSGAVSAIPGVVFSGAYDGHIRAYTSADGKVLWDYDTAKEYEAVNGIKAQGGALDGPGPTIINGYFYVNSGYARWGGMAGNALLAFTIE